MPYDQRILSIIATLKKLYPDAVCSLDFMKDYELLFSTRLAAQCTDARVNIVAKTLYKDYPTLESFAGADLGELEQAVKSCGFYHTKAKDIILSAQMLLRDFNGRVPGTMEELLKLPGVGRKTAISSLATCTESPP
jgi:endonuclease-3